MCLRMRRSDVHYKVANGTTHTHTHNPTPHPFFFFFFQLRTHNTQHTTHNTQHERHVQSIRHHLSQLAINRCSNTNTHTRIQHQAANTQVWQINSPGGPCVCSLTPPHPTLREHLAWPSMSGMKRPYSCLPVSGSAFRKTWEGEVGAKTRRRTPNEPTNHATFRGPGGGGRGREQHHQTKRRRRRHHLPPSTPANAPPL